MAKVIEIPFDWTDWFDADEPDSPRESWSDEERAEAEKLAGEMRQARKHPPEPTD